MPRNLIPTLLALVIGLGLGFVIRELTFVGDDGKSLQLQGSEGTANPPTTNLTPAPSVKPSPDEGKGNDTDTIVKPDHPAAPSNNGSDLETMIEKALEGIAIPQGDGNFTFLCATEDGTPIEGVSILCERVLGSSLNRTQGAGRELPEDEPIEDFLAEAVRQEQERRANRQVVVTDASGKARIDGLVEEDRYKLSAWAEGWELKLAKEESNYFNYNQTLKPSESILIRGKQVGLFEVSALLPDGSLAERCSVFIRKANQRDELVYLSIDKRMSLEVGTHTLLARHSGPDLDSNEITIDVSLPSEIRHLRFQLKEPDGIHFTVSADPSLGSVPYATIYLLKDGDASATIADIQRSKFTRTISSNAGELRAEVVFQTEPRGGVGIEAGNYLVVMMDRSDGIESNIYYKGTISFSGGVLKEKFHVGAPSQAEAIVINATGPDGKALRVQYARIQAHHSEKGTKFGRVPLVRKGDDSAWAYIGSGIDYLRREFDGEPGKWLMEVHTEFGERAIPFRPGSDREVRAVFEAPSTVITLLRGVSEAHHGSIQVTLQGDDGSSYYGVNYGGAPKLRGGDADRAVSANDRVIIKNVQPGTYEAVLVFAGSVGQNGRSQTSIEFARVTVNVSGEFFEFSADVPRLYRVTIIDQGGKAGDEVAIDNCGSQRLDTDLKAVWEGIPDGEYRITRRYGSRDSRTIRVNADMDVRLDG